MSGSGGAGVVAMARRAERIIVAANVNCGILPGHTATEMRADLERMIADPGLNVTPVGEPDPVSPPPR